MHTPQTDTFWTTDFAMTPADLDEIVLRMRTLGFAYDLTRLMRFVIVHRLHHGSGEPVPIRNITALVTTSSVRLWNPADTWKEGDQVLICFRSGDSFDVTIGEVAEIRIDSPKIHIVTGDVDAPVRIYKRADAGSEEARTWYRTLQTALEKMQESSHENDIATSIILTHGDHIASCLFDALTHDERFVGLNGRWFLRELAVSPSYDCLLTLAQRLLLMEDALATEHVLSLIHVPMPLADPELFGFHLALLQYPTLFHNSGTYQHPRWSLAGPPPITLTAHYSAYDPDTYAILCVAGQAIAPENAWRLWNLQLLRAVVRPA